MGQIGHRRWAPTARLALKMDRGASWPPPAGNSPQPRARAEKGTSVLSSQGTEFARPTPALLSPGCGPDAGSGSEPPEPQRMRARSFVGRMTGSEHGTVPSLGSYRTAVTDAQ